MSTPGRGPERPFFDSLVGKRIAGRYLVERILGSGGMGLVASAKYPELGQRVAIKFLRPEYAEDKVVTARFLREARVAAKVKSPHFVRVFDVGKLDSGVPYLVMEMLTGQDLSDELRERGPLSVHDAIDYILQAGVALAELHAIGIIHRDLKPSNLFVEKTGDTAILKVLDFGISKEQKKTESVAPLTNTDHVLGTPQYMSPEQIRSSKDVDARSDVWSLGVIFYELLSQSLPFVAEGGGVGEMFGKILYVDAEKLSTKREGLPDGLEKVLDRCLARERNDRYASVLELAEALRPFASDSSLHRIEMLKKAAKTVAPAPDDDPVVEIDEKPELAATQQSTPEAKRDLAMAPTAAASERNLEGAPVTAMTSSSKVSNAKMVPPPLKPRMWVGFVAAIAIAGAGVAGVMAMKGGGPTGASSNAPSPSIDPPAASTTTPTTTAPATTTTPSAEPVPSSSPSAAPPPSAIPSATPRPRASSPIVVPAKPSARPAPSATGAPTLILDRK